MLTPLALEIYHRYQNGETVEQIAQSLQIPADRIAQRIRAAVQFLTRRRKVAA